jgi:hypothetical protein
MADPEGRVYLDRRALQNDESMVLRVENVGGYQAVQLERYWLFVRRLQHLRMKYQYALFEEPPAVVTDLLDIDWVIAPASRRVDADLQPVADDGRWMLHRRPGSAPRATVVTSWKVVGAAEEALEEVARPGFDPAATAILERDPGIGASRARSGDGDAAGSARYRALGPQTARVDVETTRPGIVVIRNVWDRNWRATVDGRPSTVLATDYAVQGVPVPAGRHSIVLSYDDPMIGYGMLGSGLAIAGILGAAWFVRRRDYGGPPDAVAAHGTVSAEFPEGVPLS